MRGSLRRFCLIATALLPLSAWAGTAVPFTINLSKAVNVVTSGGTPRIAVDVAGTTRYANYTSGSGTSALVFTYNMQAGDVDLDGVAVSSPVQLNGGTIKDLSGNPLTNLTFTPPNTAGIKVNYPSLGMDFTNGAGGRYTLNGTPYTTLASFLSAAGGNFTRASVGTYFDSAGVLQTASANTPRLDYDPVTHAAKGILIEEQRTNLMPRSSAFENGVWGKTNVSVTANVTAAPDGAATADKLIASAASTNHNLNSSSATALPAGAYAATVYAKAGEYGYLAINIQDSFSYLAEGRFNLNTGTASLGLVQAESWSNASASITSVGNGWYRCQFTATTSGAGYKTMLIVASPTQISNAVNTPFLGDATSGAYIWGAQLEQGAFPTSYIPTTTTATVTRVADVLTVPIGGWFTQATGTWMAEAFNSPNPNNGRIVGVAGNSSNYLGYGAGSSGASVETWDGVANLNAGISPIASSTVFGKYAMSWSNTSMQRSLVANNGSVATGTIGLAYAGAAFAVGSNANGNPIDSTIRKIKYYPARVPNTQLQLMTQ